MNLQCKREKCFMTPDFTLTKFSKPCDVVAQHYPTVTMAEYFSKKVLPEKFALMRHDIDRKPGSAMNTRGWSRSSR